MNLNRALTVLLLSVLYAAMSSQPLLTPEQAHQRAAAFLSTKGRTAMQQPARLTPPSSLLLPSSPSRMLQGHRSPSPLYIFNTPDDRGFVVVSPDERTAPILGYVDHGTFDTDNMPEGLAWLLQTYGEQIAALNALPIQNSIIGGAHHSTVNYQLSARLCRLAPPRTTKTPLPPLLQSLWNQGAPYNILCPRYLNEDCTEGDHSATGCVATAIAQVMGYYRHPAATERYIPAYNISFDTNNGKQNRRVQGIPRGSAIDWDNILPVYDGHSTAVQDTAIAQLMLYVGVGCKMGYGPSSAAGFSEGVNALINYFGYDDGTHIEQRGNYTIEGWDDLLYNEIATGHPIAFAGTNTGGAHAFVLDGYDADGLYHLNWGWGGLDNGYFRIDVLAPDNNSGIGASLTPDGYNMGQEAIISLRLPDDDKSPTRQPRLTVNDWELRSSDTFFANYVNWTGINTSWDMGLGYIDYDPDGEPAASYAVPGAPSAGRTTIVPIGSKATVQLNDQTYSSQTFTVSGLAPGTYHIVPISKRSSVAEWQTHVNPDIRYVLATVSDDGQVKLEMRPIQEVEVTDITFPGNHRTGDRQSVRATFRNLADEYFQEVHLFASTTDDHGEQVCRTAVIIPEGGETVSAFYFTPDHAGTWNVWLAADDRCSRVIAHTTVDISDEGTASPYSLRYVSHSVNNKSNGVIYGNRMQGRVTILNQSDETFSGNVRLWLFKLASDNLFYGASSIYVPVTIEPKKTAQANFLFEDLELNATYNMSILYEEGGDIQDGGLRAMGTTQRGIVYWLQNQNLGGMPLATTVTTPAGAVAVDLRGLSDVVKSVRPNANTNTLYLLDEGTDVPDGLNDRNVVSGTHAPTITLTDGYGFLSPLSFVADKAVYHRAAAPQWEGLTLPFTPDAVPDGLLLKAFTDVDATGQAVLSETRELRAATPYVARNTTGEELTLSATDATFPQTVGTPMTVRAADYQFVGVTTSTTLISDGIYVLSDDGTAFVPAPRRAVVSPFRSYFVYTGDVPVEAIIVADDTEGITSPQLLPSPFAVPYGAMSSHPRLNSHQPFDLQGRPCPEHRSTPGLLIINGKKVINR